MRTTPLAQWREQASKFAGMIRNAILKGSWGSRWTTFVQTCLTPRLGGLGLRKVVEHADLAYHASWHSQERSKKPGLFLLNIFGDHATCCAKKEDVIIPHNALRNLIDKKKGVEATQLLYVWAMPQMLNSAPISQNSSYPQGDTPASVLC